MLKRTIADGYDLEIENGEVRIDGYVMGRLDRALKKGYHPTVRLTLNSEFLPELDKWIELDEDVVEVAVAAIDEHIRKFEAC